MGMRIFDAIGTLLFIDAAGEIIIDVLKEVLK